MQGRERDQTRISFEGTITVASIKLHVDGLVQERHNSSALAMELHLSCTNPLMCSLKVLSMKLMQKSIYQFCYFFLNKIHWQVSLKFKGMEFDLFHANTSYMTYNSYWIQKDWNAQGSTYQHFFTQLPKFWIFKMQKRQLPKSTCPSGSFICPSPSGNETSWALIHKSGRSFFFFFA